MTVTVFRNCSLLELDTSERREGCDVAIENDRIREVSDRPIKLGTARIIDVGGRTLMPGLIDAHVHVFAIHLNQSLTADMPLTLMTAAATHRLKGMIDRGFTTVRDVAGGDYGIQQAVERGLIPGPRLFVSNQAISQTGGHGDQRLRTDDSVPCSCSSALHQMCRIADGPDEVRKAVREQMRKGANQIKLLVSGGVGSPHDPLESRQYSAEELRAAVDEAAAWNTYVTAHSYTSRSTTHAVEAGVRCIEHGNLIDRKTADLMAQRGVFMVPTLVCYDESARLGKELGLTPTIMEKLRRVNDHGVQMLAICRDAGVKMGFGTDLMGELHVAQSREFAIRAEVLRVAEVLQAATLVNAEILGRTGELGVIAPGALADLLVVDGNPLQDINLLQDQGAHMPVIMKGGRFHKMTLDH
jgi:imidazolonepropionase-like amidohydrolase